MRIAQGDIVTVDFPFSDGRVFKRRPALVLSTEAIHSTGDLLLMQVTSKPRKDKLSIGLIADDLTNPLPLESFLRLHKIFALDKSMVVGKLSQLKRDKFLAVLDDLFSLLRG